jgi:DNA polymerase-3 subunit delta'
MLILVANNTNLLATIVSRCQVIRLRPLPREHVTQALITHAGVEPERAALLAAWSNGRIGWALHAASSPDEILARQEQLETLLALHSQPHSISFRWAEDRSKEYRGGEQTTVLDWLDLWQSWWRDLLLTAAGCPESITHIDRREDLEREARRYKLQEIYRFVVRLDEAARQLRENVNPQLALENLLLHLPGRAG